MSRCDSIDITGRVDTGEDNADAHLKRQIMGREVVVAITKGKLDFGPWEQIFYGEFDGRNRFEKSLSAGETSWGSRAFSEHSRLSLPTRPGPGH